MSNQQVSNQTAGTVWGIMLAVFVIFIVGPFAGCVMCVACSSVAVPLSGATMTNNKKLRSHLTKGQGCQVSSECEGTLVCRDDVCVD